MKIFITGINGFLGSALARHWEGLGHEVAGSARRPSGGAVVRFSLGDPFDASRLGGVDRVIHCAHDFSAGSASRNIAGTKAVYDVAKAAAVPAQIFVSSYSARPHSQADYGHTKYELETFFLAQGETVVRPGLVIGNGGLFGGMLRQILKWPVIPLLDGGEDLAPVIGIDDFAEAMTRVVSAGGGRAYNLFHPDLVTMRTLVETVNRKAGHHAVYFSIRADRARWLLGVARGIGLRLPFSEDSLTALKQNQEYIYGSDLGELVAHPASLDAVVEAAVRGAG